MKKIILISLVLPIFSYLKATDEIKPSRATLESNVGEMQVEMIKLDNGHWKLNSLLDGGSIVRREESEIFELVENQIKPIKYDFNQRILFRRYKASADFNWDKNEVKFIRKSKCFCTHECFNIVNILFNPKFYPKIIKKSKLV